MTISEVLAEQYMLCPFLGILPQKICKQYDVHMTRGKKSIIIINPLQQVTLHEIILPILSTIVHLELSSLKSNGIFAFIDLFEPEGKHLSR